jgi:hypothetical protein
VDRIDRSEGAPGSGLLRVQFAAGVSAETLGTLHSAGLDADLPAELRDLLSGVGAKRISGVYELTDAEIVDDKYGFASEFQLALQAGRDPAQAARDLEQSPLVQSARPMFLRRSSDQ